MLNRDITGVELTYTQIWVLADTIRAGHLPEFLSIKPKLYIYDDQQFNDKIIVPLHKMGIIGDDLSIHPDVVFWLKTICESELFVNILFTRQDRNLRMVLTRRKDNEFMYMWASGTKIRVGSSQIFGVRSLLNFINEGLDHGKPARFTTFSLSKNVLQNIVEQIIHSEKELDLEDIQKIFEKLDLPNDLVEIMSPTNQSVKSSATLMINRREYHQITSPQNCITILDTSRGRILLRPDQKAHGTETIVYESGSLENFAHALEQLFIASSCEFWFADSK